MKNDVGLTPRMSRVSSCSLAHLLTEAIQRDQTLLDSAAGESGSRTPGRRLSVGMLLGRVCFSAIVEKVLPRFSKVLKYSKDAALQLPARKLLLSQKSGPSDTRQVINFDSPRTAKAAAQLGITYENCIKR
jgi:hypothetical protein